MKTKQIAWLTRTALLLALTVAVQAGFRAIIPAGMGQQLAVGTLVNLLLITAAVTGGFWSGYYVASLAPVIAFLQGHLPPFWPLVIAVALGNLTIVAVFAAGRFLEKKGMQKDMTRYLVLTVAGALCKTAVLYLAVVKMVLPVVIMTSALPDARKTAMSAMLSLNFSWPQLITAFFGGILFTLIYPTLQKAVFRNR